MKLSDLSIDRAVTFTMIFIAVAGIGLVALMRLSPELLPEMEFPGASIMVSYKGVGPEDLEKLIARPIEEAMSTVTDVEAVSSNCKEGAVVVSVSFSWGKDMDAAMTDIREQLDMIRDYLPDEADDPIAFKFDTSMMPVIFIAVSGEAMEPAAIRKLAEDKIEPALERIPGVALASTSGGEKREIQVQLNRERMEAYKISINQVTVALRGENITMKAGNMDVDKYTRLVRTVGEFTSAEQINDVAVAYQDDAPIYIRDIAEVLDTAAEKTQVVRVNGESAVTVQVQKQSGANTVDVANGVKKVLRKLEPTLGGNIELTVLRDQSKFIKNSLGNILNVALVGGLLAILVLFLFLHNVRSVAIIALAIPMSIVATFVAMDAGGVTLNVISMGGLALGIGMLVDNAIVVLESVFRHREQGKDRREAASVGTSEVSKAIIASTLTTVSVFLPIMFVPGIAGLLFRDQALTVVFSLICSLLVALTLVPLLSSRFLALESERKGKGWIRRLSHKVGTYMERMDGLYQRVITWALDHRKTVILAVIGLFIVSFSIFWPLGFIGTEFMPDSDMGRISLSLEMTPGTSLAVTEEAMKQVEQMVIDKAGKALLTTSIDIGSGTGISFTSGSSHSATVDIELVDVTKRDISQKEVEYAIKDGLAKIPDIKISPASGRIASSMGMSGGPPVAIEIYGHDRHTAKQLAGSIKAMLEQIRGTYDVRTTIEASIPETQIVIDRDRAYDMGLTVKSIADTMNRNLYGSVATRLREGGDEYDILVRLREEDRLSEEDMYNTTIMSSTMQQIPLRNVASLQLAEGPVTIDRKDQERSVTVTSYLRGRDLGSAMADIRNGLKSVEIPEGFSVQIGGSGKDMMESFGWLGLALLGAIFLVYAVMASLFESLLDPFIIIFTIPLALIGVIWMFFLTGTTLSILGFVGMIVLAGIVVNNAIVLVDYTNQLRANGMELREAVITAGRVRIRPILMTALTTILAMIPMALGLGSGAEMWYPLARAVVGGLTVSTILTLVIVPVVYVIFENQSVKWKERRKLKKQARTAAIASELSESAQ